MILIYTALLCEAQSFIEYLKLKKVNSLPKIYQNDNYLVVIGGIGKENTVKSLNYIFLNYTISKAINIGVAGVSSKTIKIGELFCCNHQILNIKYLQLKTVDNPQRGTNIAEVTLYDMEGEYFKEECMKHLRNNNLYIFKIVSDYLNDEILEKDFIKSLIKPYKVAILECKLKNDIIL